MKRYLILSDLDGTLSRNDGTISQSTIETIKTLLDKGHLFFICTGRMIQSALKVAATIDPRVQVVGSNGGVVHKETEFVVSAMSQSDLGHIYNLAVEYTIPAFFFSDRVIAYTDTLPDYFQSQDTQNRTSASHQTEYIQLQKNPGSLYTHPFANALLVADASQLESLKDLKHNLDKHPDLTVTSSYYNNIEVFPKTTSKGQALKELAAYHHIDISQTIAFGDGDNDLEMLREACISVAVENAVDAVRAIASDFTDSNEEDGVNHFLQNYFKEDLQ